MPRKTFRLLDLVAFLAGRRSPASIEQIMEAVPEYAERWTDGTDKDRASIRRTFERDKADLRELGVPIRSVPLAGQDPAESPQGYLLSRRDLYLPYVRILGGPEDPPSNGTPGPRSASRRLDPSLDRPFEVEEHELAAALEGLVQIADLPGSPLADEARSAYGKLTFDLDHGRFRFAPVLHATPESPALSEALELLLEARRRRKRVTFRYHGLASAPGERAVEPYGIYFRKGNWYLFAHDRLREATRTFRVSRMERLTVNDAGRRDPDYEIPDALDLRAIARREPWELGCEDERPIAVRVLFRAALSRWAERNRVGTLVERREDGATVREFRVRDLPAFLSWTAGLEGRAQVLSPVTAQRAWRATARRVAALHAEVRHA